MMNNIRIYLDNCCYNRPYDNQDKLSVKLETTAKIKIQEMVKKRELDLIWSFMIDYENSANPGSSKRNSIFEWFYRSAAHISMTVEILERSELLNGSGFGKKNSIHLSCAISANSECFITVDNGILNKRNQVTEVIIIDPVEFIRIMEDKNEK